MEVWKKKKNKTSIVDKKNFHKFQTFSFLYTIAFLHISHITNLRVEKEEKKEPNESSLERPWPLHRFPYS